LREVTQGTSRDVTSRLNWTWRAHRMFDTIIVGGGSAGSILANRLSARGTNRVLLCEAGEDTPDGRVPEAILDSRSGLASRDPRFLWHQLRVTTEVIPRNDPGRATAARAAL